MLSSLFSANRRLRKAEIPALAQDRHRRDRPFGRRLSRHEVQALSFLRPWARRLRMTLRPPAVAMRARKPWRRARTSFEG